MIGKKITGGIVAAATLLSLGLVVAPTAQAATTAAPAATPTATGTTYYVDCQAAAGGDGTQAKPFNSFTTANVQAAKLTAGDQLLFKRGTTCTGENQTVNGAANVKAALRLVGVKGTADAPIVVSDYGDASAPAPVLAGDGVADVVLLRNSEYVTVQNLDITNTDAEANHYKYMRRGITAENDNAGKLSGIVIRNNTIHDIYGEKQKDLGGSAAIQLENYGRSIPVDGATQTKGSVKTDNSRKTRSWFDDVQIVGNTITNVNRSGINMSTDFRCREDVAWDCGLSGSTRDQYPWTPNTNLYIAENTLKDIGGDGIVVQMSDGAVVEKNYLENAASISGQGSNAGIWNWNSDNTLFQYNEVTNTQRLPGNNDGTAWDFDYGTRNTVFQYNYSHDNAGGSALVCACTNWMGTKENIGLAIGGVFRYNLSVNDGVAAKKIADNVIDSYRTAQLYGITDLNFYNNTVVLPEGDNVTFAGVNNSDGASVSYANNVIIAQDGTNLADQNGKVADDQFQLNYGNNLYVGGDAAKWAKAGKNGNTTVTLADYLAATGVDLAAVAKGDLSSLYGEKATAYAKAKGRAMASDDFPFAISNTHLTAKNALKTLDFPHGFNHAKQTYGDQVAVSGWSAPAVGAFQGAATTETGKAADLAAGKSATIDAPGNSTIEVTATTSGDAQLGVALANDRGYTQTTSGEAGKKTLFVRTSSDVSKLTLTNTGKSGDVTGITLKTVYDQLWDGSFESVYQSGSGGNGVSPWSPANRDHSKSHDNDNTARVKRYRSDLNQKDAVVSGERAAKLGKLDGVSFTQIDQRNIPAKRGKTYQLGFWATTGDSTDDKSTVTATVKYRKEGSGAGGSFGQYATQLLAKSADGKTAAAGEKIYVTGSFTVPWDAAADSALWVNIQQGDLKDGSFAYIDNVTLTEVPTPATDIASIAVTKQPTKTAYKPGEELDTTGLEVTATLNDGKTRKLDASEYTLLGFDSTKAGTVTVTVKLNADGDKTATFDVTVKNEVDLANKFCANAAVSDVQTKWGTSSAKYTCDGDLSTNWSNWKDASENAPANPAWANWTFDKKYKLDNLYFYVDQTSAEAAPKSVKVQYLAENDKDWVDTDITFTPNTSDKTKPTVADLSKLPATKAISLILTPTTPSNDGEYPYVKVAEVKIIQAADDNGYTPVKPATNVPTTDKVPTYTKFEAIADPGTGSKDYFKPLWYAKDSDTATTGKHIQAHGGQVVPVQENGKTVYYWYGEDRSSGYYNSHGVHVYRSEDGMNWVDKGIALRSIYYDAELTDDDYFVNLYGLKKADGTIDTAKAKKIAYYLNTNTDEDGDGVKDVANAIFERPKVLYNAKTKKYVMWWHADGSPTVASTSNYARSLAGVAVSDSPTGPFKLVGAYRLPNREDYKTGHSAAVPGGSRDMTVFQDDDGTAYVVYSSEENRTLYIAKLNDDYTNVVKTTTDTSKIQDIDLQYSADGQYPYTLADGGEGAPVSGKDFVIVKDRGMLEAPALFKTNGKYYLIASGATGWAPNKQTYYTADSILGKWIRGVQADDEYENTNFASLPEGADGLLSVGDTRGSTFGSQTASVFEYQPGKFIYIGDRWNSGAADSTYVWLPLTVNKTTGALTMQNPATQDPSAYGDGWDASYWDQTASNPLNLESIKVNGEEVANFDGGTLNYTVNTGVWGKVPTVEATAVNPDDVTVTTDVNTARAIITVTAKDDKTKTANATADKTRVYKVNFTSTVDGAKAVADPWKTTSWGNAGAFAQGDADGSFRIVDKANTGAWTNKDNLSAIYQPAKLEVGGSIVTTITSSQAGSNEDPRAGIIVRNDLSEAGRGTAHGYALLVAGVSGSFFQTDSDNNGYIDKESAKTAEAATSADTPLTIKLVRNSKTEIEGFYQVPGSAADSEWKSLGTATLGDDAADKLDVGVFATSNNGRSDYNVIFDGTAIATKAEPTVESIKVAADPTKTEYTVGDTFSADGLKVTKSLSDGTEADVDAADYTVSAADASGAAVDLTKPFADAAVGKVTVTVTLTADPTKTATFEITVKAKPVTVTGIKVTAKPTTTEYTVGQTFSADGLTVIKTMSDGTQVALTDAEYTVSAATAAGAAVDLTKPFADAAIGKVTVTVSLKSDTAKTATFDVTVKAKPAPTLESIKVASKPSTVTYTVGDTFTADGLKVVKVMSDKSEVVAEDGEYTLAAVDADGSVVDLTKPFAVTGKVTVTVLLDGKKATFDVTVNEADKSELNAAIADAEKLTADKYTAETWAAFEKALAAAKEVAGSKTATAKQVADALAALKAAQDALVVKPAPTVESVKVTAEPKKVTYKYGETFSADGLAVAAVLSDGTETALEPAEYTVTAVDADGSAVDLGAPFAVTGKVTVTVALKADPTKTATFTVTVTPVASDEDRAALAAEVTEAEKLKAADYESGWDAFQAALAAAKDVLADPASTKADLAAALNALKGAQDGLVRKGQGGNGAGNGSGNGGSAVKPGAGAGAGKPQTPGQLGLSKTGASVAGVAVAAVLLLAAGVAVTLRRRRA
ncbi:bacterial Ig-like domain-containing protein [Bifidobacterium leontopitheci]|uniref:Bacterial Ig-like domain (Group 3) n=1 Tax=Bifidobacterium leontopitheci TaxID=2650774 RepID=A0A6I1GLU0_9BIFI|nr:bacterial Ig-like domain-containing protein [Bifidobacterium leontopitheci]KAB7790369.1 Bacterial Ig-like domain (group 3) [Bifidobacterium leontopitheci]